ncbi:MAG: redoxin domain-containing protein [Armatimonadota bacterium]|nr:redoxin domain-containing protein [Armatimonadota bacterium]
MTEERDEQMQDTEDSQRQAEEAQESRQAEARPAPTRRRRSPLRIIIPVIVLVAIAAIGGYWWLFLRRPPAEELLRETVARYSEADHVRAESTMSMDMNMDGQETSVRVPMTMAFSRPNRMVYEVGEGMSHTKMVSDGEHMFIEIGMLAGAVAKLPAPENLADFALEEWGGASSLGAGMGMSAIKLPDTKSMVTGEFDPEKMQRVEYGIDPENEWVQSLEKPGGAWPLTVAPSEAFEVAMWIDRSRRVVRKLAVAVDYGALMAAEEELRQQMDRVPEFMRSMLENMTVNIEVDVESIAVNEPAPEGIFQYQPPEGAKVIEADSMRDAMQKLMEQSMGDMEIPDMPEEKDLAAQPPADFTARDMQGNDVRLSNFKGSPLILDIWATWCAPCVEEFPILDEIYNEYNAQGLKMVAASTDGDIEAALEGEGWWLGEYRIGFIPQTNPDGILLGHCNTNAREELAAFGFDGAIAGRPCPQEVEVLWNYLSSRRPVVYVDFHFLRLPNHPYTKPYYIDPAIYDDPAVAEAAVALKDRYMEISGAERPFEVALDNEMWQGLAAYQAAAELDAVAFTYQYTGPTTSHLKAQRTGPAVMMAALEVCRELA